MSIRNLDHLFRPKSVAVFGASVQPHSVGATLMENLLGGGFGGPVFPVNPKYKAVSGIWAYPDAASLPETPDLAVLCTPPRTVPGIIDELGRRGTRAAVVLTAGLDRQRDAEGRTLREAMLDAAKPHLLRILGPNCVGIMLPPIGLNASFAHTAPLSGDIAFVTQSGALATGVLDSAKSSGVGFSCFVSLGNSADIDFGDVVDYLATDAHTRSILLYIESIRTARKFMSAARAASRSRTIVAVKAGRVAEGAAAAASHTGALAGADDVYEAALRRAGVLRVDTIEDLFDAVETLGRTRSLRGDRLAIFTNGGGPAVMATDALVRRGGRMAELGAETIARLDACLPSNWSRANPVDIIGDAPVDRYARTLEILSEDPNVDAVLFIHALTAIVPSADIARALVPIASKSTRNVLTCWLGRDGAATARRQFSDAGLPTYDSPEDAVGAFMQMVDYHRNQVTLMQTPPSVPERFEPDQAAVTAVIRDVLSEDRELLTEPESKKVLAAYAIATVETRVASTPDDCEKVAMEIGLPVAIKIVSPDITHKSDVGGVVLDLETPQQVREAAGRMLRRLADLRPDAELSGISVQKMVRRPGAHELIVGTSVDPVFGPVLLFGQGGTAVEIVRDRAVGLPPLNIALAREIVGRTRVSRLLAGYRDRPAADLEAINLVLIKLSQLIADVPEIVELDINPLLADDRGVLALDARVRVIRAQLPGTRRFAIRPYPNDLEEHASFVGQDIVLRPIRPEDESNHRAFFDRLSDEDVRFRFCGAVGSMPHAELARYTQIDFDREMAFIAARPSEGNGEETLGVVRALADPDNGKAEFAIVVRSDLKGKGLGHMLLDKMVRYSRKRGTGRLEGETMAGNVDMLGLARSMGFSLQRSSDGRTVKLCRALQKEMESRY
ncbi:MAG: GNAT family N-acetyltransferase [Phycisphaeraceae bacterium]|nr:GNAT family N-acetyltransferase [Phycisphaeraceae bacterium]